MTSPEQADLEAMKAEVKRLAELFANQKIASGTMGARDARFALFAAIDRFAAVALHPQPPDVHLAHAPSQEAFKPDWANYEQGRKDGRAEALEDIPTAFPLDAMVDRFLWWRLPDTFSPDSGISFTKPNPPNSWPTGTNLFTAEEARAMLKCLLEAAQPAPAPVDERLTVAAIAMAAQVKALPLMQAIAAAGEGEVTVTQRLTMDQALQAIAALAAPVDARKLAWELAGVLEDVKRDGFDDVCLRTIQRVHAALLAQEVHPVPRQLREWAALQDESDGSPWSEGYEAARRYVAMHSQQPDQGRSGSLPSGGPAAAQRSSGDEADRLALDAEFEVHCNGDYTASACGPREDAWREACHYSMVYAKDGPITIYEVTRRLVAVEDTGVPQDSEPTTGETSDGH
jgi:hypothetical protein